MSPANSFGFMDGGFDAVYTYVLGLQVQARAQDAIRRDFDGELPVGCALIVATERSELPWCVIAPTMRVPEPGNALPALLCLGLAARTVRPPNAPRLGRFRERSPDSALRRT